MKSKATPGPWHRNIKPARKYNTVFADRNTHIAHVSTAGLTDDEIEANIELIIKAPAMRDALVGARKALLKALPHLPADDLGIFCGEWLVEINEVLGELYGWKDGQPDVSGISTNEN